MRNNILDSVKQERERQDSLWGNQFDDKNTPSDWALYINHYVSLAVPIGKQPFNYEIFMLNMKKVAALAVAASESCERNNGMPLRHWELETKEG